MIPKILMLCLSPFSFTDNNTFSEPVNSLTSSVSHLTDAGRYPGKKPFDPVCGKTQKMCRFLTTANNLTFYERVFNWHIDQLLTHILCELTEKLVQNEELEIPLKIAELW